MELLVFRDYFAPKIYEMQGKIHGIYCSPCNFNCKFCSQSKRNENVTYFTYSLDQFDNLISELMLTSDMFKLTGGEPTMMPEIVDMIRIINKHGGKVFLDTNGSRFQLIKQLADENLIYVLGISIKGLTPEESLYKSRTSNVKLCWDNIIDSCNYVYGKAKVILTYVVDSELSLRDLEFFCEKLGDDIKVDYFKLNNLYGSNLPDPTCKALSKEKFEDCINSVLAINPHLRGKLIVIDGFDAVKKKEAIRYF